MDQHADIWLKEKRDISFAKFHMLITLADVSPVSQKQLAHYLGYSDRAVDRMVKILPEYINVSPGVGRDRVLSLTPDGKTLLQTCAIPLENMFVRVISDAGIDPHVFHEQVNTAYRVLSTKREWRS